MDVLIRRVEEVLIDRVRRVASVYLVVCERR